jgi:hypothetical protein
MELTLSADRADEAFMTCQSTSVRDDALARYGELIG